MYSYDSNGWFSLSDIPGRQTDVAPSSVSGTPTAGKSWPNWTGSAWVMAPYVAPVLQNPTRHWKAYDVYRKFTMAENIAIHTLSQTDSTAAYFIRLIDNAIASGSTIASDDPDFIAALNYFLITPPSSPVLTQARLAAITS